MVTRECTFKIKTLYPKCTCPLTFQNGQVTSAYMANKYLEDFGKNPNWEVSSVKHYVMQQISVDLSISQVYRSRKAARGLITGNKKAQYGLLRDYAEMIRMTDVGSKVSLLTEMENENAEPKFKRMYIRYNTQKVGFLGGCRPFVRLDGCRLKGRFGGQLLSATAKNGNDNIFPVAMAVGLLPAMETLFPTVEHRYYVKHIYNNFKVNHKGIDLKSVLWRCADKTSTREFERGIDHLKSLDEEAWKYLADIELAQWTRTHFSSRALIDCLARDKPILAMLEWIKFRLMTRLYTKKIGIEKYGSKLCPSIQDKLEKLKLESKNFYAIPSGRFVYEVDNERERHVVDLVGRTCSRRAWDLTGIPCKHEVAAIFVNREKLEDYTHSCYYKDAFVETYKTPIPPMPGQFEWMSSGQPKPVAPIIYKPPGRPPLKRKKDADEPGTLIRCLDQTSQ
ncbi:uncharacterized protein LOC142632788 [Castanea sativa]|uniref:uncharacterized protein LOC142632788 n=1 Tax=Castanea sativa TaxID=21020 RepID=UPI003F651353